MQFPRSFLCAVDVVSILPCHGNTGICYHQLEILTWCTTSKHAQAYLLKQWRNIVSYGTIAFFAATMAFYKLSLICVTPIKYKSIFSLMVKERTFSINFEILYQVWPKQENVTEDVIDMFVLIEKTRKVHYNICIEFILSFLFCLVSLQCLLWIHTIIFILSCYDCEFILFA